MHATDFLKSSTAQVPPVVVLAGTQRHWKQLAWNQLKMLVVSDEESCIARFQGRETTWQIVSDELHTVSMWGDRRLVQIEEAEDFVSRYRGMLEKYVVAPAKKSVLVLEVVSWPKSTRLAKQVAQSGLEIECTELKGSALLQWLVDRARETYSTTMSRDAATLLVELVGTDIGLLDQELAKLSSYVGSGRQIAEEDVRSLVGGWRTETTWAMTDAVRDGRIAEALVALGQLQEAGEPSLKLLGGISFVFRKYALATERARHMPLEVALKEAGVFPHDQKPAAAYLRRIGRDKAEQLLAALAATDAGLKGASRLPERLQLELLLLRLAGSAG